MNTLLETAFRLINQYALGLYLFAGVGILWYLVRLRRAARERRYTPFQLEREEAATALRDSLFILCILFAILATTFYIDRILLAAPTVSQGPETALRPPTRTATSPAIGPSPTPPPATATTEGAATAEGAATEAAPPPAEAVAPEASPPAESTVAIPPSATPEPPAPEATATLAPTATPFVAPTATVQATAIPTQPPPPTATPPPAPPPVPAARCNTPGVRITSPGNGQTVSGSVGILGTADIERFQFYKVEYGPGAPTGAPSVIGDVVYQRVTNGVLATWNASAVPSGVWTLRLTAVDETGNFPPPCDIYVIVP